MTNSDTKSGAGVRHDDCISGDKLRKSYQSKSDLCLVKCTVVCSPQITLSELIGYCSMLRVLDESIDELF